MQSFCSQGKAGRITNAVVVATRPLFPGKAGRITNAVVVATRPLFPGEGWEDY